MQKAVIWQLGVCGRGLGNNSVHYTSCQKWVHRKCGGIVQSDEVICCRGCVNPVIGIGCISVNIGVNANLELMDKFGYLGDMLSVDGDADAAVENRI